MRRPPLALLLGCLLLVAGASALDGYDYYQTIEYAACDQETYQQDIVIHRSTGTAYNETAGGLEIWHIFVGEHCREDYGDVRFTNSTGELAYYLWPGYDSSSARVCIRLEGADQSGTLTVWYGNQSAEGESDGDAVGYCDAFSEISEAWNTSGVATATIDDGRLKTTGIADTWKSHKTASVKRPVSIPYAFSAEVDLDYVATPNCLGELFLVVETSSSFTAAGYQDNNDNAAGGFSYILNGGSVVFSGKNTRPASGKMHLQITRNASNTIKIYENGNIRATGTMGGDITAIGLTNTRFETYAGNIAYWDNLVVRAYSATPPAALTFSGEQETVAVLQPFPGIPNKPRDPTGTGLYTDINGNNRLDYNDLTVFFQNLAWAKTNQPLDAFDFNRNGRLDYNDVITLFSIITEEHP